MSQSSAPQHSLRTKEAAVFLGVSHRTLEKHRLQGTGPKFSKLGGRILYARSDLKEWLESATKRLTTDSDRTIAAKPIDELDLLIRDGGATHPASGPTTTLPARRADRTALRSRRSNRARGQFATNGTPNVVPLAKRKKSLEGAFVYIAKIAESHPDGIVEADSITHLGTLLRWTQPRTSKALKAWKASGQITVDHAVNGKLIIRVMPIRAGIERARRSV